MHPAELLREEILRALDRSKTEIAKLLGVSRQTLYDVLSENQPVTPGMALRLGKLCGNGPELWLNPQKRYDLHHAQQELVETLKKIPTLQVACARGFGSSTARRRRSAGRSSRASDALTTHLLPLAVADGIANLRLPALRGAEGWKNRRLQRSHRGRRDRTDRCRTDRRQIDGAFTQRLHLPVDTLTCARRVRGAARQQDHQCDQDQTHAAPPHDLSLSRCEQLFRPARRIRAFAISPVRG